MKIRKRTNRSAVVLMVWLVAMGLFGCKSQPANQASLGPTAEQVEKVEGTELLEDREDFVIPEDAKFGGTLRRAISQRPRGLNWLLENSVEVTEIAHYVHAPLARRHRENPDVLIPALAESIVLSADKTEFKIRLRDDVYWHVPEVDFSQPQNKWLEKPRKMTSSDVALYFDVVHHDAFPRGALASYFKDLEDVEIVDEETLIVRWKKPIHSSTSITIAAMPVPGWLFSKDRQGRPLEGHIAERFADHWANDWGVGVGPYRLVKLTDERLVLERNESYYGKRFPIDEVHYIAEHSDFHDGLVADELDFSPSLHPNHQPAVTVGRVEKEGIVYQPVDRFAYYYIGWNQRKRLFTDRAVRKALAHTADAHWVSEVSGMRGKSQPGPFYREHPAHHPDIEQTARNLDKAASILEEAGWTDGDGDGIREKVVNGKVTPLAFELLRYDSRAFEAIGEAWKKDLKKIGVEVSVRSIDWTSMQNAVDAREFDAYTGGWGLSWLIDPYQIWHSSQVRPGGSNHVGFQNEEADKLIEELRVTFDEEKRLDLLRRFHRLVHEEQPYLFLMAPIGVVAWNDRVKNVTIAKTRPQFLSFDWYIEP